MVGTRLIVHSTFVVELILLVVASFLYASNQRHDPFSSADPFLADKSGWKIIVEDVSPAPSPDYDEGFIAYAGECASAIMSQINSLMGAEEEKVFPDRPRRSSKFVQELRQKISTFPFVDHDNGEGGQSAVHTSISPPLRFNLRMPQVESPTTLASLAAALERGLQSGNSRQKSYSTMVSVGIDNWTSPDSQLDASDINVCDNFQLPIQTKTNSSANRRKVDFPEIIILIGCSSATIPDQRMSSVEVNQSTSTVIVRTTLTMEQKENLMDHLEKELSITFSDIFLVPHAKNNGNRIGSVSIKLIDENPTFPDGFEGFTAKDHFDIIGKALSSSAQSTISSLLEDLSFIYGGQIEVNGVASGLSEGSMLKAKGSISLEVQSSAYLALPDDVVKLETTDDETASTKYIPSEDLANWIHSHSLQNNNPGDVEWILFVPSRDNTPLTVHDELSGGVGDSIILSPPALEGERWKTADPNGMSIVNFPSINDFNSNNFDLEKMHEGYREKISQSLTYLAGYIRAIHGLPPPMRNRAHHFSSSTSVEYRGQGFLSFWELESIARSYFSSSLELAFSETDALMAALHQHADTLTFPEDVAHKLNNATHLLRQSISLIEKGFPTIYATSLLHGSLHYLDSVQNDYQFMELPYFAPDHYLAVFSPLVLPLMLPMVVGLIREVKRFRDHKAK